jgi:N-acetylmuramoyl-L-alanine amidase
VHDPQLTRRRALGLGAAALAASALAPPSLAGAAARRRGASFELDLTHQLGSTTARAASAAGWRTLPPVQAPKRFDVLGLDFPRDAHVHVQVRARTRAGRWSPWTALHAQGDHAPDGAAPPTGTGPCWTGAADVLQVRLKGAPERLVARFVRAAPAATVARRLHGSAVARASARKPTPRQAGAAPAIIPRSAWGGDALPPKETPIYGEVQVGFVHHTVTANDYAPTDSASIVLGIARYHRDHNGWNDIGYNFLVDQYGQVFEGRAGGIDQAVVGAQAQGYNSYSTGVSCLGDFTALALPPAGAEAVAQLLAWKLPAHGVPVAGTVVLTSAGGETNRYRSGTPVTFERISGHRDGDSTACPGDVLYGQLPAIRARAAQLAVPLSTLTVTTARNVLKPQEPLILTGLLRFSDGSSSASAPVQIQYQLTSGAAWELVGTVLAGPDGSWSASVVPDGSGRVRAVFPGDATRGALDAAPLKITVAPVVTVSLSRTKVRRKRRIDVTGTVTPRPAGKISLLLERHSGRGVVTVRRRKLRVRSNGSFAAVVRPTRRGRYRVSITAGPTTRRRKLRAL